MINELIASARKAADSDECRNSALVHVLADEIERLTEVARTMTNGFKAALASLDDRMDEVNRLTAENIELQRSLTNAQLPVGDLRDCGVKAEIRESAEVPDRPLPNPSLMANGD